MASSAVPQNPTSQTVLALVHRLSDADPDLRFMSLNDLLQVLANGKPDFLHHDYNAAARTVDAVIKALDDQNGDVQNLAIKWYVLARRRNLHFDTQTLTLITA
jgi:cullin-associated NEDD8-dissociated protein 1